MSFEKLIAKIAALFNKTKLPYMLVGGFAVAYWGYPRQSLDIDVVLDISEDNISTFLSQAKKQGFDVHEKEAEFMVKKGNRFVMEIDDFRVDCWLPKTDFELKALKDRKRKKLFGKNLYIINSEDLIIAKLLAGRARDHEDIKTILIKQGKKINKTRLQRRAMTLNIYFLLKKIIEDVD